MTSFAEQNIAITIPEKIRKDYTIWMRILRASEDASADLRNLVQSMNLSAHDSKQLQRSISEALAKRSYDYDATYKYMKKYHGKTNQWGDYYLHKAITREYIELWYARILADRANSEASRTFYRNFRDDNHQTDTQRALELLVHTQLKEEYNGRPEDTDNRAS